MSATTSIAIKIKDNEMLNSESKNQLGMTIDNKLNFNNHLQNILKKANQKVDHTIYEHLQKEVADEFILHITI